MEPADNETPEKPKTDDALMRPDPKKEMARQRIKGRRKDFTRPPCFNIEENENGGKVISFDGEDHTDETLYLVDSLGLKEPGAAFMLLDQISRLFEGDIGRMSDERLNRALTMLAEVEPEGAEESMLAAQMVAVHVAAMNCLSRALLEGQTFEGREMNLKFGAKLSQIYAQQFTALEKKRRGGQQKVVVKHVHVNEGGQAIVGDVSTGGGG